MNTPLYTKGNVTITSLIGWGITIAVASMGFTYNQIARVSGDQSKQTDAAIAVVQRVSVVETESKQYKEDIAGVRNDIKDINKKLDILISQRQ